MPPKRKKNNNCRRKFTTNELRYKDDTVGEQYGYVKKALGGCTFTVELLNNDEKRCILKGLLKKRTKIRIGQLVLIEPLTESKSGSYMIIHSYNDSDKSILKKENELTIVKNEIQEETPEEAFTFDADSNYQEMVNQLEELGEAFIDDI